MLCLQVAASSLANRQQRQQRVYNMMKDLQQKHLATLLQGEMSERENNDMQESQNICRICHSLGDEPLITPCHCSGSAKHVHATCLLTWFKKAVKNTCELCRHKVAIKKKGRPYSEVVDMYFLTLIHVCLVDNTMQLLKLTHLEEVYPIATFFESKKFSFFCKRANKTQGSTTQGLKMLKPFELT